MKKLMYILAALSTFCLLTVAFAQTGAGSDGSDDEIFNMKERWAEDGKLDAVMFNHTFHQEMNDYQCTKCHETEDGGPIVFESEVKGTTYANNAHNFCWTCHKSKNVTAVGHTCMSCHTGKWQLFSEK